jgi:hypothetical protein
VVGEAIRCPADGGLRGPCSGGAAGQLSPVDSHYLDLPALGAGMLAALLVLRRHVEAIARREAVLAAEQPFGIVKGEGDDDGVGPVCRPGPAQDRPVGECIAVEESLGARGRDEARRVGQRDAQIL